MSTDRWDIQSILDEAIENDPNPYDGNPRYPVIVETTERHLVWLEADDPKDALRRLEGDGSWYEYLSNDTRLDDYYGISMALPESYEWSHVYNKKHGPVRGCSDCGGSAYEVGAKVWHRDNCPGGGGCRG
ncbi:hypothetical protein [Streptomyces lavendulocolor]|uniref:hypothetical protein n=1 Tax=Streptomyces lavendulocolor TaxID=67316 RepID=UPI0033C0F0FB